MTKSSVKIIVGVPSNLPEFGLHIVAHLPLVLLHQFDYIYARVKDP